MAYDPFAGMSQQQINQILYGEQGPPTRAGQPGYDAAGNPLVTPTASGLYRWSPAGGFVSTPNQYDENNNLVGQSGSELYGQVAGSVGLSPDQLTEQLRSVGYTGDPYALLGSEYRQKPGEFTARESQGTGDNPLVSYLSMLGEAGYDWRSNPELMSAYTQGQDVATQGAQARNKINMAAIKPLDVGLMALKIYGGGYGLGSALGGAAGAAGAEGAVGGLDVMTGVPASEIAGQFSAAGVPLGGAGAAGASLGDAARYSRELGGTTEADIGSTKSYLDTPLPGGEEDFMEKATRKALEKGAKYGVEKLTEPKGYQYAEGAARYARDGEAPSGNLFKQGDLRDLFGGDIESLRDAAIRELGFSVGRQGLKQSSVEGEQVKGVGDVSSKYYTDIQAANEEAKKKFGEASIEAKLAGIEAPTSAAAYVDEPAVPTFENLSLVQSGGTPLPGVKKKKAPLVGVPTPGEDEEYQGISGA